MPRHQEHPGQPYTTNVVVKMNPEAIAVLDKLRGDTPRSTYLRNLLKAPGGVSPDTPEPPPEPRNKGNTRNIKVIPERHLHRFKAVGKPVRYYQGMAVYLKECECGKTKEG